MLQRIIAIAVLICIPLVGSGEVLGSIIFSDDFNSENGGTFKLNYTGFANWDVTVGTVDLIGVGSSWNWFPAYGLYIDMDGSTKNAGTMLSKRAFSLPPGRYRLSYDLAGSQRTGYSLTDLVVASVNTGVSSQSHTLFPTEPFATFYQNFTLTATQDVTIQFTATALTGAGDNVGLLLDNVKLSAIPEPATLAVWSLLGLSGAGMWLVRRRRGAGRAPWSDDARAAIHQIVGRSRA